MPHFQKMKRESRKFECLLIFVQRVCLENDLVTRLGSDFSIVHLIADDICLLYDWIFEFLGFLILAIFNLWIFEFEISYSEILLLV